MNMGRTIRLLREEKGLTQEELAEKLHVTQSFISKVESKNQNITVNQVRELSKIFGCSADYIISKE